MKFGIAPQHRIFLEIFLWSNDPKPQCVYKNLYYIIYIFELRRRPPWAAAGLRPAQMMYKNNKYRVYIVFTLPILSCTNTRSMFFDNLFLFFVLRYHAKTALSNNVYFNWDCHFMTSLQFTKTITKLKLVNYHLACYRSCKILVLSTNHFYLNGMKYNEYGIHYLIVDIYLHTRCFL